MNQFWNQVTKVFDMYKQILEYEICNQDIGYHTYHPFFPSSTLTNLLVECSFDSSELPNKLSYKRLLLFLIDQHYFIFNAWIKNVKKTTSRQKCNIIENGKNKKNKNGDL